MAKRGFMPGQHAGHQVFSQMNMSLESKGFLLCLHQYAGGFAFVSAFKVGFVAVVNHRIKTYFQIISLGINRLAAFFQSIQFLKHRRSQIRRHTRSSALFKKVFGNGVNRFGERAGFFFDGGNITNKAIQHCGAVLQL